MRDEFYYPSKDGNTEIHTIEWKPEGEVKAVLQICHGMVEYMERYDAFANFMYRDTMLWAMITLVMENRFKASQNMVILRRSMVMSV